MKGSVVEKDQPFGRNSIIIEREGNFDKDDSFDFEIRSLDEDEAENQEYQLEDPQNNDRFTIYQVQENNQKDS